MTGYVDPFISDEEFIGRDTRLSRKQADLDYAEAKAKGGFDAALFVGTKFRVPEGYKRIPGASRSGALDPSTKARFLRREENGEIELARDEYGKLLGYRETNDCESPRRTTDVRTTNPFHDGAADMARELVRLANERAAESDRDELRQADYESDSE